MTVQLRIERLVLDDVDLTRTERAALSRAIARELRREFARGQGRPGTQPDPHVRGATHSGSRVDAIGRDVAAAVRRSLPRTGAAR